MIDDEKEFLVDQKQRHILDILRAADGRLSETELFRRMRKQGYPSKKTFLKRLEELVEIDLVKIEVVDTARREDGITIHYKKIGLSDEMNTLYDKHAVIEGSVLKAIELIESPAFSVKEKLEIFFTVSTQLSLCIAFESTAYSKDKRMRELVVETYTSMLHSLTAALVGQAPEEASQELQKYAPQTAMVPIEDIDVPDNVKERYLELFKKEIDLLEEKEAVLRDD